MWLPADIPVFRGACGAAATQAMAPRSDAAPAVWGRLALRLTHAPLDCTPPLCLHLFTPVLSRHSL